MRRVTIGGKQHLLNGKAGVDTAPAGGEIGEVRAAGGVEDGGVAKLGDPITGGLNVGADVGGDDKLERVKAVGDKIGREGEGGELGLEVLEAGNGGGEVGELEEGGFFEVLGEGDSEEGQKGLAAGDLGEVLRLHLCGFGRRLEVFAGGGVEGDS